MPPDIVMIVGGILLVLIAIAILRRAFKIVGSLIGLAFFLTLAYVVLIFMGVFPNPM